jgi:hypothetical protein
MKMVKLAHMAHDRMRPLSRRLRMRGLMPRALCSPCINVQRCRLAAESLLVIPAATTVSLARRSIIIIRLGATCDVKLLWAKDDFFWMGS